MKKGLALILAICLLLLSSTALATVEVQKLAQVVNTCLDENDLIYDYDAENEMYYLQFTLDCKLESVDVNIYLYDDMLSVSVDCLELMKEADFANMATFLTLVNNEIFYAQFRADASNGYISCRSCNVIENVLPGVAEIETLLFMPMVYMENFGDGILSVLNGADPYSAFVQCMDALEAE